MYKNKPETPKFKVRDVVSISKYKHVCSKGYTPKWMGEVFTIAEVKKKRPITYILKDDRGNLIRYEFYREELLKTKYKGIYLVKKVIKRKGVNPIL